MIEREINVIKTLIFDFDGVMIDSMKIKAAAFLKPFSNLPDEALDSIRRFHFQNGGMSRIEKFRYIYKNIINEPLTKSRLDYLCSEFGRCVLDKISRAPLMKGARAFLENSYRRFNMYIVSATPQDELDTLSDSLKLRKYFLGVRGFPPIKAHLIREILRRNNYSSEETLFIGDAFGDFEVSKEIGIRFLAFLSNAQDERLKMVKPRAKNFSELKKFISAYQ